MKQTEQREQLTCSFWLWIRAVSLGMRLRLAVRQLSILKGKASGSGEPWAAAAAMGILDLMNYSNVVDALKPYSPVCLKGSDFSLGAFAVPAGQPGSSQGSGCSPPWSTVWVCPRSPRVPQQLWWAGAPQDFSRGMLWVLCQLLHWGSK